MASMPRKLKVAVVGAGFAHSPDGRERFAVRTHLPALRALPDLFEVVATCTTRMETAQESADHFGIPHAFDSVERMVDELTDLDVVCVSVRPAYHHQVAMPALRAGKHVYCEFPMSLNSDQAKDMHDLAKEQHVKTVVSYQYHHHPVVRYMSDLIKDGFIGKPLTFSISDFVGNYIVPRPAHRQWLFQASMGGQPGYRSGRSLERIRGILGQEITSLSCDYSIKVPERAAVDTGGVIKSDQVDNMMYLLRTDGGATGTLQMTQTAWFGSGDRCEVYGTQGMLYLGTEQSSKDWNKEAGDGDPKRGSYQLSGKRIEIDEYIRDPISPERLQRDFQTLPVPESYYKVSGIDEQKGVFCIAQTWAAFHDAIVNDHQCQPSFEDGLRIHRLLDAGNESSQNRTWVDADFSGI
ncbi:MAG: putative dehydrogenase [Gammaproteobacteria bacterium]|jgi:predicted dehydrogenase